MASLLRQIVAGPRARHPEAGLDLCYVTDNIIVTSGPSQTYPQRAYRNPLDRVVAFLDSKHGANWAIWEFRAEGTGYPDELVYNRVQHYPWPDHHPPPFRLIPMIVAGMRNWLNGNDLNLDLNADDGGGQNAGTGAAATAAATTEAASPLDKDHQKENANGKKNEKSKKKLAEKIVDTWKDTKKTDRVVVVHCKAGKGRSGTVACSYLIAECGWTPEQALARFTERRMRPKMGPGVSIPSQLRTIGYVERWARSGDGKAKRLYVERPVEIVEIHVWGLRNGVKLAVEGYADEGKSIQVLHTFSKRERHVVDGAPPGGAGVVDMVYDMAGYSGNSNSNGATTKNPEQEVLDESDDKHSGEAAAAADLTVHPPSRTGTPSSSKSVKSKVNKRASTIISKISRSASRSGGKSSPTTGLDTKPVTAATTMPPVPTGNGFAESPSASTSTSISTSTPLGDKIKDQLEAQNNANGHTSDTPTSPASEPGGRAVIFKPRTPIRVPTSDVNITVERRNRAPRSVGLTMVTAVAHVWFNAFFEGNGPEQGGRADPSGVFEIDWDRMDGIKGSSQKGTRAADRIAVVWRVAASDEEAGDGEGKPETTTATAKVQGELIEQPGVDSPVPQMRAADWKSAASGGASDRLQQQQNPDAERRLGLRLQSPEDSAEDVSRASSVSRNAEGAGIGVGVVDEVQRRSADAAEDARELGSVRSDVSAESEEGARSGLRAYADKLPRPGGSG
ncbi:Telomerase protein component 1 [Diatrype stigma]|uniref:phosphatidylinositol-3,4,5-trisphosphate 3-phosphatase n=1 Tax=Diatrype stigma TaxID=117547 RepID=A0AAN9UZS4_9PEZI